MRLELDWRRPYGVRLFPDDNERVGDLLHAGGYLRIKLYVRGKVAYTAQHKQALVRTDRYVVAVIALSQVVHDRKRCIALLCSFESRVRSLNVIESVLILAIVETERTRFSRAFCGDGLENDRLRLAEYFFMWRLRDAENANRLEVWEFKSEVFADSKLSKLSATDENLLRDLIRQAPPHVEQAIG